MRSSRIVHAVVFLAFALVGSAIAAACLATPPVRNCKACDEKCCPKTRNCSCLHTDACTCITMASQNGCH